MFVTGPEVVKTVTNETVTKEQYEELLAKTPTVIDWNTLVEFEDNVEGVQTLSCTAGNCEI